MHMAEMKRSILFGKLNPIAYKAVESATIFYKLRGNPYVELVHWLHQMFQPSDSDQANAAKLPGRPIPAESIDPITGLN